MEKSNEDVRSSIKATIDLAKVLLDKGENIKAFRLCEFILSEFTRVKSLKAEKGELTKELEESFGVIEGFVLDIQQKAAISSGMCH